ncbi:MAG: NAD-dependent deacylase [Syntrophomonadaceae bacterium]|nr:NAD-dependent deacylase [Syntrophomonadaceae bacterium]
MQNNINQIAALMANSRSTTVVTGAGISTEAGIPDFRGPEGIYRKLGEDKVMRIINIDTFRQRPELFYEFYREHFKLAEVAPGRAHYVLAELEARNYIHGVVTQNIDGLHQKAGSKNVIPVHGTADRFVCQKYHCGAVYDASTALSSPELVPRCEKCGGVLKPDVVLFGESIQNFMDAQDSILSAQLLIVIGSSLTVYPLAGFVRAFDSFTQDLVILNKGPTSMDHAARVKIDAPGTTGAVLEQIAALLPERGRA